MSVSPFRTLLNLPHLMPLRRIAKDYPWIHTGLGLLGNTCFFVGSVFFFFAPLKTAGIWLFTLGSLGMLIDTLGEALLRLEGFADVAES
ncbi:MAG TPA: YrhK family protein [Trueperaceae bacterium]|nr:YrhK family protein [Trueperaceae bacterium]